ncbi:hypothetical protein NDU88_002054 [Pleurodeles waltl]|uniref:Uncharacterized protein n=1 Tax=Pleurodeles waltl TaxID=8319 RepID=A0AAV7T180_PLEWA|nr:hypothetical protein NDU88_002054 [Pleurodeles waltl]
MARRKHGASCRFTRGARGAPPWQPTPRHAGRLARARQSQQGHQESSKSYVVGAGHQESSKSYVAGTGYQESSKSYVVGTGHQKRSIKVSANNDHYCIISKSL